MALSSTARRRLLGSLFLLTALGMLVLGQTVLNGRLQGVDYVCYWMGCVVLTGLALLTALLDMRALQHRSRKEQRDLLASTLKEIQRDATTKPRRR